MTQTAYLDFELEISESGTGSYPVAILRAPAGEARGELILPESSFSFSDGFYTISRQAAQIFGAALFTALFTGDIRDRYAVSQQMAAQAGQGLRLKLRITPAELLTVPWELLYDPREDEFVCLTRQTPLVRYLTVAQAVEPLAVQPPLRILGLIASPNDLPNLDVAGEQARLSAALAPLQTKGLVELTWVAGQSWRDLQQALQNGPWHVFHYVGHAEFDAQSDEGALWLADEGGQARALAARELARLLADQPTLRLAVLNACAGAQGGHFSSLAGRLVRRGLPAVIAMQTAITDGAALEFSQSFYAALANSLPVDAALSEARKAISFSQPATVEWATPVLYLRAPDGALWKPDQFTEDDMPKEKREAVYHINTGGGNLIQGDVNTGGGDFVGRNKTTHSDVVHGHKVGGDLTITTIGDNAKNVAVGKNVRQSINEVGNPLTAADKPLIQAQFQQLLAALQNANLDVGRVAKAEARIDMLQEELTKVADDESPDDSVITKMGDWLLDNLPEIAGAVTSLFTTAAVGKVIQKAGKSAVDWVKRRIG